MAFYTLVATLLAAATFASSNAQHFRDGGRYQTQLFDRFNRVSNNVGNGYDLCNNVCVPGTVCTMHLGTPSCLRIPGGLDNSNYGPLNPLNPRIDSSYGRGVARLSECGYMSPNCIATNPSVGPFIKYTYNPSQNACEATTVCQTCASLNGPQHSLFDSRFQCNRFCQV